MGRDFEVRKLKGFLSICLGTILITGLTGCGGGGSASPEPDASSIPEETPSSTTPGAVNDTADVELQTEAVTVLKTLGYLRDLVFFGEVLDSGGVVTCLNGDRVTQTMTQVPATGGIPVEGSVRLSFQDCQINDDLMLNNSVEFTWSNFQYFQPGELVLDAAEAVLESLELKSSDAELSASGPLLVSYSAHEGRTTKSSESSKDGSLELRAFSQHWDVDDYQLVEEQESSGEIYLTLTGEFADHGTGANRIVVSTDTDLLHMPGEDFPRQGKLIFSTMENSLTLTVDSQETVTLIVDNGADGTPDSEKTYSWTELLALAP